MRKLLIASYHFPPSAATASFRLLGFSRHLPSHGWTCDVVAPPVTPWEARDESLAARVPETTRLFEVPFLYGPLTRRIVALTGYSIWLLFARKKIKERLATGEYAAVMTSGPPHVVHQLGVYAKRRGFPWLADFRDPWSGVGNLDWVPQPRQWGDRRITARDSETIPFADAIVANAPKIAGLFREAFPQAASRVDFITNGYDPEDFAQDGDEPAPATDPSAPVEVVHTGGVYAGRNPVPVMEAVGLLNGSNGRTPGYRLKFVGSIDPNVMDIHGEIRSRGLESCVEAVGRVPFDAALREMKRAGILLLLDTPGRKYGLPAKFYEYVGAGRPILAIGESDSDLEWALKESGVPGRVVGYDSPELIARGIRELAELARSPIRSSGVFTRSRLAGQLAARLDAIVDAKAKAKSKR